jgi:hypothetical protein
LDREAAPVLRRVKQKRLVKEPAITVASSAPEREQSVVKAGDLNGVAESLHHTLTARLMLKH